MTTEPFEGKPEQATSLRERIIEELLYHPTGYSDNKSLLREFVTAMMWSSVCLFIFFSASLGALILIWLATHFG